MHFLIETTDLLNAFWFKLPAKNFSSLHRDYSEDFFIEIELGDTGYYEKAKPFYKKMMDKWRVNKKPLAKLVLKVYHWMGPYEMNNIEKENIAHVVSEVLVAVGKEAQEEEKHLEAIGVTPRRVTRVPYYDICFDVVCNNVRYNFDIVQQSIVLFENLFGLDLQTCSILDFKNHSFHDVSKTFSYAIGIKKKRKSSLDVVLKIGEPQKTETNKGQPEESKSESIGKLLTSESEVIDEEFVEKMQGRIPNYLKQCKWKLVYSTSKHGISLATLYRNCSGYNCEMVLLIKEARGGVIGGFLSNKLKSFNTFYGTGECQVFSYLNKELKTYEASLENNYFLFSNDHGFGMGSGDHSAIMVDEELKKGETKSCITFESPQLLPDKNFTIKTLELWTFDLKT